MLTADLVRARRRGDELVLVGLDADGPRARARTRRGASWRSCARARRADARRARRGARADRRRAAGRAAEGRAGEARSTTGATSRSTRVTRTRRATPRSSGATLFLRASAERRALAARRPLRPRRRRRRVRRGARHDRGRASSAALFADLRGAHVLRRSSRSPARRARRGLRARAGAGGPPARGAGHGRRPVRLARRDARALPPAQVPPPPPRHRRDGRRATASSSTVRSASSSRSPSTACSSRSSSRRSRGCEAWRLEADVRWGKERAPLSSASRGAAAPGRARSRRSPDEVAALLRSFQALGTAWRVSAKTAILELPGVGWRVPDLVFERADAAAPVRVTSR